jgi:hypothetical protein
MLMDLEEKLRGDGDGHLRNQLLDRLAAERQRLKSAVDAGVAPGDFLAIQVMLGALESAASMLDLFWKKYR